MGKKDNIDKCRGGICRDEGEGRKKDNIEKSRGKYVEIEIKVRGIET